jgi:beta-D-xylosidase 4
MIATLPDCTRDPLCSNPVCDTSLSIADRAAGLVTVLTLQEKINSSQGYASEISRLGIPSYKWDAEALHGVANSYAVSFQSPLGVNFSSATQFPAPLTIAAAFDDSLTGQIASVIGSEARAFINGGYSYFAFMTPNINPFRDPRWGRGMETPGEDIRVIQGYTRNLIPGLQGGLNPTYNQIIATCKHYAAYDIEDGRNGIDLNPTLQDLAEFYSIGFKTCIRDVHAGATMCSYNAVDGIPSCGNRFLLQNVIREHWGYSRPSDMIISDCGAVVNIYDPHHYVPGENDTGMAQAAAIALNAGTDIDCGPVAYDFLNMSIPLNMTTEAALDQALGRSFGALIKAGYFDNPSEYASLSWADVNKPASQQLSYQSAVEGTVLLKNDGTLPLPSSLKNVALIGPYVNATEQMQADYFGTPPFFITPLAEFQNKTSNFQWNEGTLINTTSTTNFSAAINIAKNADYIIYLGGIDTTIEIEGKDRTNITWPGNQLDLIGELAALGKKLIVVQFGAGQLDDTVLLNNKTVNAVVWAGYPGPFGGKAIYDVLTGAQSIAGRLPTTQYPADYVNNLSIYDMNLRPGTNNPGRTYVWYTGNPVLPFGYGLHYTNFSASWDSTPKTSYSISSFLPSSSNTTILPPSAQELLNWPAYNSNGGSYLDLLPFINVTVDVRNTGKVTSDYVGLLFISTKNAGPSPYPNKWLASYGRLHNISAGSTQKLTFSLTLDNIARTDTDGNRYVYPGDYTFALDYDSQITFNFTFTGTAALIDTFPTPASNVTAFEYVGCYSTPQKTLSVTAQSSSNDPQSCVDACKELSYQYSGVQQRYVNRLLFPQLDWKSC